jgi:Na+/proline symporter
MLILSVAIYLALQIALCVWISRKIQTKDDYFLAGRSLTVIPIAVSLFATWFGAESCMGTFGMVYQNGLSASRADPFGYTVCLVLLGILVAPKIWNLGFVTLADFFSVRFGKNVAPLAAVVMAASSLAWAAAQLRAFGHVLSITTETTPLIGSIAAVVIVLIYTSFGGLLGDIVTDFIQGLVIVFGLLAIGFFVFTSVEDLWALWQQVPKERLSFSSPDESWWQRFDHWAIPVLGSLVTQEQISRLLASKSRSVAVRASLLSSMGYLVIGSLPIVLALVAPSLVTLEGDSDSFFLKFSESMLPRWMYIVLIGAILSALLSTIDSIFLAVGSLMVQNVLPVIGFASNKSTLLQSRLVVIGAGILALVLSVQGENIYELLEIASSFGTAGILVITIFGLWSKLGGMLASISALVCGILTPQILERICKVETTFLITIAVTALMFVVVARFEKKILLHNPSH